MLRNADMYLLYAHMHFSVEVPRSQGAPIQQCLQYTDTATLMVQFMSVGRSRCGDWCVADEGEHIY